MNGRTTGKVAIVTGGSSGIGAAVSRMLAAEGVHVVVTSEQPEDTMAPFCAELADAGGSGEAIQCDVTDGKAVAALVEQIGARHGGVDMLINSAGVFHLTPAFDIDMAKVDQLIRVNYLGAVNLIQACLPVMRARGGGGIVSIASAAGVLGGASFAAYSASKAAIIHFTRTLASELGHSCIRINCVAPGSVRTPMTAFAHDPEDERMKAILAKRRERTTSPYGELLAEPDDIANVVMFLLSDRARAIQGSCIVADQGFTAASTPLAD